MPGQRGRAQYSTSPNRPGPCRASRRQRYRAGSSPPLPGGQQRRAQRRAGVPLHLAAGQLQQAAGVGQLESGTCRRRSPLAGHGPGAVEPGEVGLGRPGLPHPVLVELVEIVVGEALLGFEMFLDDLGHGRRRAGRTSSSGCPACKGIGRALGDAFGRPVAGFSGSGLSPGLGMRHGRRLAGRRRSFPTAPPRCGRPARRTSHVEALALAAETQRHAPALGENSQHVLEAVGGGDGPAAEADHLVVGAQPAAIGVGLFQDVGDHDAAVFVAGRPARRGWRDRRSGRSAGSR